MLLDLTLNVFCCWTQSNLSFITSFKASMWNKKKAEFTHVYNNPHEIGPAFIRHDRVDTVSVRDPVGSDRVKTSIRTASRQDPRPWTMHASVVSSAFRRLSCTIHWILIIRNFIVSLLMVTPRLYCGRVNIYRKRFQWSGKKKIIRWLNIERQQQQAAITITCQMQNI